MVAIRYQVAGHLERIQLAIGKHHRPLNSAESGDGSGTVGGGDGTPRLVDGLAQKVVRIEGHSKGTAGIDNDRYGFVARIVVGSSLGFESGQEGGIDGRSAGLVDFWREGNW